MKIEQQLHARRLNAFGHLQRVRKIAKSILGGVAAVAGGVVENTQAHIIQSMVFQYLDGIIFFAVGIVEFHALVFQFRKERDIGAEHLIDLCFFERNDREWIAGKHNIRYRCREYGHDIGGTGPEAIGLRFEMDHGNASACLYDHLAFAIE